MLHTRRARGLSLLGLCLAGALAALTTGFLSLRSDASSAEPGEDLPLLPGAVIRADAGFELAQTFSGQVMSYQDAGLGFEVAGVVGEVLVAEGDTVAAGQVLVRLRQSEQRAATAEQEAILAEAEASLEETRADARLAELVRERRVALAENKALPQEALEMAETDVARQNARVRSSEAAAEHARASLQRLRVLLDQTELRAPFTGRIASLPARVGAALEAGAPAVRLVDLERPYVHVGLPVSLAAGLSPGAELGLVIESGRYPAHLVSLAPAIDTPTRTVLAVLRPDSELPKVRAGELVSVEVTEWIDDPGAWIPLSAIVEGRRGLWSGHFLKPDTDTDGLRGRVEQRPLQVVLVREDRAYVRGPISNGDIYLRDGLHRAVPGQRIRVSLL